MLKQVRIIYDPEHNDIKKGEFFEDLLRKIFDSQRYHVSQRINFTGMEIDLIAKHKDRNELVYIECKAKSSLSSSEIKSFAFNVSHHNATYGYFLSVNEYSHQVAGLIEEMKTDSRYENLYFWGPDKIVELLESSKVTQPITAIEQEILVLTTKAILVYTYFGVFYVLITNRGTIPTNYYIFNAKNIGEIVSDSDVALLEKEISEIEDLSRIRTLDDRQQTTYETIALVQESEDWADYRPASVNHFVGRQDATDALFQFIKQAANGKTNLRVFYIDGKSGWGKSSLINALNGKIRNSRNRKKYFLLPVDTRSANTGNFVALSFKRLIDLSYEDDFIRNDLFSCSDVQLSSTYDINIKQKFVKCTK